jgi:hypothetical protein
MIENFWHTLQAQFQNQLFVGGLALGLVGVLVAMLRNIPGLLWSYGRRLIIATAVIDNRTNLFDALVVWLNDLPFGRKSRFFTVIQTNEIGRASCRERVS